MNWVRFVLVGTIALLALAVGGCTVDKSAPSGWQGGGGWDNFRA